MLWDKANHTELDVSRELSFSEDWTSRTTLAIEQKGGTEFWEIFTQQILRDFSKLSKSQSIYFTRDTAVRSTRIRGPRAEFPPALLLSNNTIKIVCSFPIHIPIYDLSWFVSMQNHNPATVEKLQSMLSAWVIPLNDRNNFILVNKSFDELGERAREKSRRVKFSWSPSLRLWMWAQGSRSIRKACSWHSYKAWGETRLCNLAFFLRSLMLAHMSQLKEQKPD
jgi:hypothetical protein